MALRPSAHRLYRDNILYVIAVLGVAAGASGASADTIANYSVDLSGSLLGNPFSSNFTFDQGMNLSGLSMNLQGSGFNAGLGDVYTNWDNLGFAQRSYRGLSLGVPVGKAEATLVGGSIVTTDEFGREKSSPIYGVRASLPLNDKLGLSASQLFSPKDAHNDDGRISSIGLKYQFSPRQSLSLESVRSENGSGWQLSGQSKGKRLGVRMSYRQTDTGFSQSGNPFLRTNRNGGFLSLSYRLSTPLSFSATTQRYSNGEDGGSSADSLRLSYSAPKQPQLALFLESRAEKFDKNFDVDGFELDGRDTSTRSAGFEVAHRFGKTNLSLRYANVNREGSAFSAVNGSSDQVTFRASHQLDRQTRLSFTTAQSFGREEKGEQNGPTSRSYSFLNLERRFKSGASVNAGLQHQTSDIFGNSGQAIGVRAGFKLPVSNGTAIGVQYHRSLSSSGGLKTFGDDRIYLSFSRDFDANRKMARGSLPRAQQKLLAEVNGGVYEDGNGNGRWDAGERGISGITLNLKGRIQATTDQNGRFKLTDLATGDYNLRMQTKTLPIELSTMGSTTVPLQLGAGEKKTLEFPVMKTGRISGIVFRDTNRNGQQDAGEDAVSEAVVQVEGSEIIGFSDEKGRFSLSGLPPRQWHVFVDGSSVGELAATNAAPIEVVVPANGEVAGLQLGLAPVQKAVINTFVK